jgi:hypothetical protein
MNETIPEGCLQLDQALELVGRTMFGSHWRLLDRKKRVSIHISLTNAANWQPNQVVVPLNDAFGDDAITGYSQFQEASDILRKRLLLASRSARLPSSFVLKWRVRHMIPGQLWDDEDTGRIFRTGTARFRTAYLVEGPVVVPVQLLRHLVSRELIDEVVGNGPLDKQGEGPKRRGPKCKYNWEEFEEEMERIDEEEGIPKIQQD